jgi:CheY-like chemotaxis protein
MRPCRHGFSRPRVLIIEDEGLILAIMVEMLTDEGYEVQPAGDGRQALDLMQSWLPCLILLDIMMPVMDGYALLEELAVRKDLASIPVVLVSAAGGPLLSDVSMRVADVIRKPYDLDRLVVTVEEHVT